jgi:ferredoxin
MNTDEEGFLYPDVVHDEKCINCLMCVKVCPVKSPGRKACDIIRGYGGYSNDVAELKSCASGGFASAVSYCFIKQIGGIVYGVRY